jgi:membrane protein
LALKKAQTDAMTKPDWNTLLEVLKLTGSAFAKDKVTKLSASLAYYTTFSLAPMLIVIIYLCDLIWGQKAIEGIIFEQTKDLIGPKVAFQLQEIIKNSAISGSGAFAGIAGVFTLLLGASSVFSEIQDSINTIWRLSLKPDKTGWFIMLKKRLLSFSAVIGMTFLLLVSLIINSLIEGLMDRLREIFPDITVILVYVANLLLSILITASLFAIIFKVLPDAVIRWRDVAIGSLFTAVLFMIGRVVITFYIAKSNPASAYGATGSLVILLLWVYYSSIILYLGAEFTKFYALKFGKEIRPNQYAMMVQIVQVESRKKSMQENEVDTEKTERELQKVKDRLDKQDWGAEGTN